MKMISQSEISAKTVKMSSDVATYHVLECFPGSLQVVQVGGAALNSRVVQFLERRPAERAVALSEAQRQHQPKQYTPVALHDHYGGAELLRP